MRQFALVGLMAGIGLLGAHPALAQPPTRTTSTTITLPADQILGKHSIITIGSPWGPKLNGRWWAGYDAPGGWAAYRPPQLGYVLPDYWMQTEFLIVDYAALGLPTPPQGFGWSRYYDDAVLSNYTGRVEDARLIQRWDERAAMANADGRYGGETDARPAGAYGTTWTTRSTAMRQNAPRETVTTITLAPSEADGDATP